MPASARTCLVRRACRHDDGCTCLGEHARGLELDPGIAAGHDGHLAVQVGATESFPGSGMRTEAGIDGELWARHESVQAELVLLDLDEVDRRERTEGQGRQWTADVEWPASG